MESSDNVSIVCMKCEHCPVSRRCGMAVKRRTDAEVEYLIRIIFISPHYIAQLSVQAGNRE